MEKLDVVKRLFGAMLILVLTFPGIASADPMIAEVENLGDTLVFHPVTEFAQLVLTVTGPCDFQYRQVVTEDQPFFRLDEATIDGRYTYSLFREEAIDPGIIKVLLEARKNFDDETPKALCRDGKLPGPPAVQSEGFGVFRGEIIYDPKSTEKAASDRDNLTVDELAALVPAGGISKEPAASRLATKDFVINDDLIVDGSACIGFDCVNGEVFSFDTIRLKENNLRIKFDDTSTSASFPRNDWQLTANDSANGGQSKFSIDDVTNARTPFTVEANARSHSLYVDDGGRIGNRTSTPSVEFHSIDGDTPTLRLQQDGSSGFAPQTWDLAGNETNFFVRDVTGGSTLPFRIRPGAPSSSIFIDEDGNVGLGTSSPDFDLDIDDGTSDAANFVVRGTSGSMILQDQDATSGERSAQHLVSGGSWRVRGLDDALASQTVVGIALELGSGQFGVNTTTPAHPLQVGNAGTDGNGAHVTAGGTWTNGSSRQFKENIVALSPSEAKAALVGLNAVRFRYTLEPEEEYVGFIAEDVPELVASSSRKYLSPMDIVAVLTKVVQEQQKTIEDLSAKMTELESQLDR